MLQSSLQAQTTTTTTNSSLLSSMTMSNHSLTNPLMVAGGGGSLDANNHSSSSIINSSTVPHSSTIISDDKSNNNLQAANISSLPSDWLQLPKMDNIVDIFSLCCSTAVIVGSLVPYIPQYLKIKRSLSSDGFSTYVCLTLLLANILRIIFWFGHHFELPLLIQSFVVITGMLILMELCVRVRDKSSSFMISTAGPHRQRRLLNGKRSSSARRTSDNLSSSSAPIYAVSNSPSSSLSSADGGGRLTLSDSCSYQNTNWTATRPDAVIAPHSNSSSNGLNHDSIDEIERDPISQYQSLSAQPRCHIKSQHHRYQSLMPNASQGTQSSFYSCWSFKNMKYALGTRDFWDWDHFSSYLYFLFLFTLAASLLTYLLIDNHLYVETLGFVAVLTESMLGMPQLVRNYNKKSTLGMSVEMVVMWLSGDLFKTLYYVLRHAPPQFIVCGSIQIIVDILILYQVIWYRRPRVNYRKLPTTLTR